MYFHNIHEIDISSVAIEDPVQDAAGRRGCSITYNGMPLKVRVPVGLVTEFHPKGHIFHTDGSGHSAAATDARFGCVIGFGGCDPYGKERSTTNSDASSVYNFVLSLYDRIVNQCVENGVKLFGKNRSEGVIREILVCIHTFINKDNGNFVQSGEGRPSIRPTIAYSDMERHGDVRMTRTDDAASVPFAIVSPSINHKEFYMTPCLLLCNGSVHVTWNMVYVSEA